MKEFIVKTKMSEVKFNFPTNLNELSKKYLEDVTNGVTVAPNYSLIGLVYHEKLGNLIMTCRSKKNKANFGVAPIFIKSGGGDTSVVDKATVGQKLLISGSAIELAYHCAAPSNKLTIDYFAHVIDNSIDSNLYEKAMSDVDPSEVLFVEFKIIANCDIIALYSDIPNPENPYIEVKSIVN